jgi:putative transposase
VKGRKRHLLIDTLRLVLNVLVTEADVTDRDGGRWLLTSLNGRLPRLRRVWVDGSYSGVNYHQDIQAQTGIDLEVVEREPGQAGFKVLPRRWVVERTFSWFGNYRRLSKDYEYWIYDADAMLYAAMVHLMTRRLARSIVSSTFSNGFSIGFL